MGIGAIRAFTPVFDGLLLCLEPTACGVNPIGARGICPQGRRGDGKIPGAGA
jgi:hypothetical protein